MTDQASLKADIAQQLADLTTQAAQTPPDVILQEIDEAEAAYARQELTLEQAKIVIEEKQAILAVHKRLLEFKETIVEEVKKQTAEDAEKAIAQQVTRAKALKGNTDYPKLVITRFDGPVRDAIKLLTGQNLKKDRYILGKQINAFHTGAKVYPSMTFNGNLIKKSDMSNLLVLRLNASEAVMAKTASTKKVLVVDDSDAAVWCDMNVVAHGSQTTHAFHRYDEHFQRIIKLLTRYFAL